MFTLDDVLNLLSDGSEYEVFDSNGTWITDSDDLYDLGGEGVASIESSMSDKGSPVIMIYMA